ncbi:BREX-2 system adenine-specific DNA-methyltransferase PglX [Streptomyces sp. BE147]|uniref:BREX-2 system adenine-specific DNA-methyltransferase PglX n=1 Tax=Streptomyces sp. BE147 TaxID=3002524 RepID=UPI002E77446A|nr:BREX-2 system adenine-specific DNA-methyltransferase PglX [Streptomyces sp. BE147]MEE1741450.1 BREX-2 system adenine-specific DNA-methyltransferase PglX [Streptomyces sp. BE147]
MIDRTALKTDLIKQVKAVEVDLGKQVAEGEKLLKPLRTEYGKASKAVLRPDEAPKWEVWLEGRLAELSADRADAVGAAESVAGRLRAEYDEARGLGRTAATWNAWLDERITQVAVAWVLGTVFVRFCEDNRLIPEPYLTGAEPERRDLAEARYAQYVEETEDPTYRGWLLRAFEELGAGQAGKLLFRQDRNPLYQIPLSHDGARALVEFWRERREGEGGGLSLVHDFTDPLNADGTEGWDTRFLGDLYQDLSEAARKTYALLQTPEFVEEFILDRTMDPVVREMGGRFNELKMIDPTCGSGHFVLGAFRRLVRLSAERHPDRDLHERVRDALNSVHGVDINPFAVAIARFRLLLAAMAAANVRTLAAAGRYDWPVHLAVGDSLIQDRQQEFELISMDSGKRLVDFAYATEDLDDHSGILERGRYDVVVGNPPYITVKDKKLNSLYRGIYDSCSGRYALSVPFAERFFQLARTGEPGGRNYGMVGQITANSFMKREFGTKLIEEYFAYKAELREVIDTSGAFIPGHGTPTVILIGKRRTGSGRSDTIRTVRSIQGEPGAPKKAEDGKVWTAIVDQIDKAGSVSPWVSVDDLDRHRYFAKQPWILTDGGLELNEAIETGGTLRLKSKLSRDIGFASFPGQDDAFISTPQALRRKGVSPEVATPLVVGEVVRDWDTHCTESAIAPYGKDLEPLPYDRDSAWGRLLWVTRSHLRSTVDFDGKTQNDLGKPWWAWYRWVPDRYRTPLTITFAFVSTHNHFALDRGGKVFKQTSPVIKLRDNASESEHLQLIGLLNSSTACFWLQQVSHNKGEGGGARVDAGYSAMGSEAWKNSFEFSGGGVEQFPLPDTQAMRLPHTLDTLSKQLATCRASAMPLNSDTTTASLRAANTAWHSVRAQMIALQEELDWQVYSLYKLHSEDLRAPESEVPELALGERAFEIVLARRVEKGEASGEWFKRHGSTPITEMPDHWSDAYKAVVQKRIDVIESSRAIGMVERPEYKRRWATEGWDILQERALKSWLLDRIEKRELWFQDGQPTLLTRAQLTSALALDEDFVSVADLYAPRKELTTVVAELLADEHVPFLPALRYKPSGLKKRADWEDVWKLQRAEDAAPDEPAKRKIRDAIPVPPKYTSADFLKPSYWRARGKLDVPKERFISYATGAISGVPDLFGWAGWDHQEQAQALTTYFTNDDGLSAEQMVPLLAGLLELQPWLGQWHNEFDPLYSGTPAAFFTGYRSAHQGEHGLTDDDLRNWRPAPAARRGRRPAGG